MRVIPAKSILLSLILILITACNWLNGPDRWTGDGSNSSESQANVKIISLETPTTVTPPVSSPTPSLKKNPTDFFQSSIESSMQAESKKIDRDITYCAAGTEKIKLDVYFPQSYSNAYPVVIFIHGGGWSSGDKSNIQGQGDFPALLQAGFVVVSINYRLVPENPFPIPIEDAKCAVRFIRANAKSLQINPDRIGVMGESAGGYLAAMLGSADSSAKLEGNSGWPNVSSQVQAVVNLYGPTDLRMLGKNANGLLFLKKVFNQETLPTNEQFSKYSPLTYISPDDPPVLIIHGENDSLVQVEQAYEYFNTLQKDKVHSNLIIVENAGHGLIPHNAKMNPSRTEITKQIVTFFEENLK